MFAQTPDGYLWLGTTAGLFRFDGVRFQAEERAMVSGNPSVVALYVAHDGTLWIGRANAIVHMHDGRFDTIEFLGYPNTFAEGKDGTIWVARSRTGAEKSPLCSILSAKVTCIGEKEGVTVPNADHLVIDREGALWIGASYGVVHWKDGRGQRFFEEEAAKSRDLGGVTLALASDGSLLAMLPGDDAAQIRRYDGAAWHAERLGRDSEATANTLSFDRTGALWIGTLTRGVYRAMNGMLEQFGSEDGLSGDFINSTFEDSEGGR